eukprot:scaffold3963_cov65-Cylindrotheca_fusiformis.AAC.3
MSRVLLLLFLGSSSFLTRTIDSFYMPSSTTTTTTTTSSASPTSVVTMNAETTSNDSMTMTYKSNPRSCILQVGVCAGRLCCVANTHLSTTTMADKTNASNNNTTVLVLAMSELLQALWETAKSLNLDLILAIHNKLELNNRKYPVELCKGKAGKYTQYSAQTGVTKDNQSMDVVEMEMTSDGQSSSMNVQPLVQALPTVANTIHDFASARSWAQYHTPRNLVLALLGEVGELAEILQWNDDKDETPSTKLLDQLSQELADVSIYLLRLATVCNVVPELAQGLQELYE